MLFVVAHHGSHPMPREKRALAVTHSRAWNLADATSPILASPRASRDRGAAGGCPGCLCTQTTSPSWNCLFMHHEPRHPLWLESVRRDGLFEQNTSLLPLAVSSLRPCLPPPGLSVDFLECVVLFPPVSVVKQAALARRHILTTPLASVSGIFSLVDFRPSKEIILLQLEVSSLMPLPLLPSLLRLRAFGVPAGIFF